MLQELDTDRLLLRRWHNTDLAAYQRICADPRVMRFIADGSVRTPQQVAADIAAFEDEWEANGFGIYAIEEKATRELIGFCGFSIPVFMPDVMPSIEITWRLHADRWGRGLATEAARSALSAAREGMPECRIVGICQRRDEASARILTKIGMSSCRNARDPLRSHDIAVYELLQTPLAEHLGVHGGAAMKAMTHSGTQDSDASAEGPPASR